MRSFQQLLFLHIFFCYHTILYEACLFYHDSSPTSVSFSSSVQPSGGAASLQKRAIQFGSRIAKLSSTAHFGAARKGIGGASVADTFITSNTTE
jgi:hypothetical protein